MTGEGGRGLGGGPGPAICKGVVEAHGGRIRAESAGLGHDPNAYAVRIRCDSMLPAYRQGG